MWLLFCDGCRRRRLYSVHQARAVRNLAAGVMLVEVACGCGRPLPVLTGGSVADAAVSAPAARPPGAPT